MQMFLFCYRAPKNYSPGGSDVMGAWNSWFQALGASVVDSGNPVFDRSTLGNCDSSTELGGYSLITAEDLEAAVALAEGCPFLQNGGGVEVGELTLLNPASLVTTVEDHTQAIGGV
jgi:hypothetical protein